MSVAKSGVGLHELLEKSEAEAALLRAELTSLRQRNAELEAQAAAMRQMLFCIYEWELREDAPDDNENIKEVSAGDINKLLESTDIGTRILARQEEARWLIENAPSGIWMENKEYIDRRIAYLKETP